MAVGVDGCYDLGVVGGFHGEGCAAVEGFLCSKDPCASVVERCEFQRVLIGFRAAVHQEQLVIVVAAGLAQVFGQLLLQGVDDRVGVEADVGQLLVDGFHVVGMAVSYADDGMAAVEVEIGCAFLVPHRASLAAHDVDIQEGVNVV